MRTSTTFRAPILPKHIARLFWDMDANALDPEKHQRVIIARVLNYGTLGDWQWLAQHYGTRAVYAETQIEGRNSIRHRSRRLASILFV